MSIARLLSELVLNTENSKIPEPSYKAATKMLLDTMACAYAGMDAPGIAEVIELEKELSADGDGTVFFNNKKLALPSAILCNASMIHALDFDNNYPGADIHILSIVVPVALACAEAENKNGEDCLSAIILGVEAAARIAKPYMQRKRQHSYFLTTSLIGGWGGVAAAARIRGLTVDQTVNAMGIYYAQTCGNRQALLEKSLTKRIQPAIAAKAAMYSVMLAEKGFTGPEHTFEGKGGFYRCYTFDDPPEPGLFSAPADPYGIEELVVKLYPTCGIHHACMISAIHLKHEHNLDVDDIDRVEFFLNEGANTLVSMPFTECEVPQIAAQFCAPYAIALALNKGEINIRDFRNDAVLQDKKTSDLAKRTVEFNTFEELKLNCYPSYENAYKYIKVYLKDGTVLEHGSSALYFCDPELMDMPKVEHKFRQCATMYKPIQDDKIDQVINTVKQFRSLENIRSFLENLN